jgi:hypothetical protein
VYVGYNFDIQGGTVSGNTAGRNGGGVCIAPGSGLSIFTKTGGIIYGSDDTNNLKNTAASRQGHAIYKSSGPQWRNVTANQTMKHDIYGFWLND